MKNRKAEPGLRLINMEDVAVEQVEWLLYPFIPYGKVTIIQGDPGEGKTTMVLQIIAKLTKGEPVLPVKKGEEEPTEKANEPVNVIYQTAEDGLGDTIKPRLLAAGADCSKVLVIDDSEQPLTMLDERLEQAIRQTNARLIVLDPIQSFLGAEVDMHRANEIRPLMKRVSVLAEKYHFQDQGYVAFTGLNLDRLQWFVNALLASFGWQEGKVFSLAALFNLAAAALILFCFVFSVRLVRGKARYPLGHRLVGAFFLAGAVCFALLYGLTNSGHSDRYLLPLAILFVPLLEIMLADCTPLHRPDARGLTALLAAILLLRAGTDYRAAAVATNPNQGAAQFLVQNGYRDGYASFWDGNVMTELTEGTLNVWTLTPNSVPELRPWLQVTSHLQTPPQGKIFFVISKWEAYGERQPTTQALADAMPEDALIYEDETVKIYGFASDEAMRQACGFAAFP